MRHYALHFQGSNASWDLDTSGDYGTGGPTYGSVISLEAARPVIGDPSNNAVTVFPVIQNIVTVPNPVFDSNGQGSGG